MFGETQLLCLPRHFPDSPAEPRLSKKCDQCPLKISSYDIIHGLLASASPLTLDPCSAGLEKCSKQHLSLWHSCCCLQKVCLMAAGCYTR